MQQIPNGIFWLSHEVFHNRERTGLMATASGSTIHVKGMFRVKLGENKDGALKIVGDSGWVENTVVNGGFQDYICASIGSVAGSKQISYMALGTGSAPNVTHTTLNGETATRKTTANTVVSSKTLQCTAAWASGDHPGGTPSISNVGLFNTSSGGAICCGNTYASSAWNGNQAVSVTYQLQFS
jgi:hypothetical protein